MYEDTYMLGLGCLIPQESLIVGNQASIILKPVLKLGNVNVDITLL